MNINGTFNCSQDLTTNVVAGDGYYCTPIMFTNLPFKAHDGQEQQNTKLAFNGNFCAFGD
ncbi:hypothetical protein FACS189459_7120 [Bacilli bacterium]|nr:hypothetical protein FACS189459_7120 [Bacilli bacterium]